MYNMDEAAHLIMNLFRTNFIARILCLFTFDSYSLSHWTVQIERYSMALIALDGDNDCVYFKFQHLMG